MWNNRFGNLTAIRYQGKAPEAIADGILRNLDPASIGIQVLPVREQGLRAGSGAVDFGQLFRADNSSQTLKERFLTFSFTTATTKD